MTVWRWASASGSRTPKTEAAKWNCAIINVITYTCALPTLTCQNAIEEKDIKKKQLYLTTGLKMFSWWGALFLFSWVIKPKKKKKKNMECCLKHNEKRHITAVECLKLANVSCHTNRTWWKIWKGNVISIRYNSVTVWGMWRSEEGLHFYWHATGELLCQPGKKKREKERQIWANERYGGVNSAKIWDWGQGGLWNS